MASVQTRQPAAKRFPLPNHIWKLGLQAGALVVLAYLQYRNHLGLRGPVTFAELEQYTGLRQTAAKRQLRTLTEHGLITEGGCPTPRLSCEKRFFTLPYEVFHLGLSCGAVAVYAFLLYREHRSTHQCTPSLRWIGHHVGMSVNTVRKYVTELEERGLVSTEPTTVWNGDGRKRNGNLRYTILPIQWAADRWHNRKLEELDGRLERQHVAKRLEAQRAAEAV